MTKRVLLTLAAAALALPSCAKTVPGGGVEVLIGTNLTVPADFDTLTITVSQPASDDAGPATIVYQSSYGVPGQATLPASFVVAAGASDGEPALIQVLALKKGRPVDLREALVQVPTDRVAELTLILAEACLQQVEVVDQEAVSKCPDGESCQPETGKCGPTAVKAPLPTYAPADLANIDASVGSFVPDGNLPPPTCEGCVVLSHEGAAGIAVDGENAYFCRQCEACATSGIFRVPLGGGQVVAVVPSTDCGEVAVDPDGPDVYWTSADAVMRAPKAGGAVTTLVTSVGEGPGDLAVYGADLYWTTGGFGYSDAGAISTEPLDLHPDGGPRLFGVGLAGVAALAVDGTGVYVTTNDIHAAVWRVAPSTGDATELVPRAGTLTTGVTLQPTNGIGYVYWAESGPDGGIGRAATAGAPGAGLVWSHQSYASALAADPSFVYWTLGVGDGGVVAGPLAGGDPVTLARHQGAPMHIAVSPTDIFWTTETAVMKVAKPSP